MKGHMVGSRCHRVKSDHTIVWHRVASVPRRPPTETFTVLRNRGTACFHRDPPEDATPTQSTGSRKALQWCCACVRPRR
jgi:hypothetical protein